MPETKCDRGCDEVDVEPVAQAAIAVQIPDSPIRMAKLCANLVGAKFTTVLSASKRIESSIQVGSLALSVLPITVAGQRWYHTTLPPPGAHFNAPTSKVSECGF